MPDSTRKQVADKIIDLLEGNAAFAAAILVGNRANQSREGWLRKHIARAPNDFPRVSLDNGRATNSGFNVPTPPTYAMEDPNFVSSGGEWLVRRRLEFKLTITGRDADPEPVDIADEAAQIAFLTAGPYLGLNSIVNKVDVITADSYLVDAQGKRSVDGVRAETTLTIPVITEQSGQGLI